MLRKKIISLGLSAATAGTLAFTVAAPAASADHNIQHTVCQALPAALVSQNGVVASTGLSLSQAQTALGQAQSEFDAATSQYVGAIQNLLNAVMNAGDVVLATANLGVATDNIGAKFTAWSNKTAAEFAAQYAYDVAVWQLGIINDLNAPC
jgi:prophage DNA circulation protein